jgi:predicted nucleic acid-binding Zn ribbon protein
LKKRQSVNEAPLAECEKCGGPVEKQWSLSGFQFKGEGWYVTDYAGKKGGGKDDKTSSDSKEKSSTAESTASTEPASKPTSDSSAKSEGSKT